MNNHIYHLASLVAVPQRITGGTTKKYYWTFILPWRSRVSAIFIVRIIIFIVVFTVGGLLFYVNVTCTQKKRARHQHEGYFIFIHFIVSLFIG
jgi:hypothetical protein